MTAGSFRPPEGYASPSLLAARAGLPESRGIVIGFSGGADSRALLDLLVCEGYEPVAVHVNHMIRGDEALRDEEFCRKTVEEYGIDGVFVRADVPAQAAASGEGTEEAARRIRYKVFADVMKEKGIPLLATAHNSSDNAESFILNAIRGASAKGARGIPPVRKCDGGYVVRPLLRVSREAITAYCESRRLDYVTDSTNFDPGYSRNRIRLKVMPELLSINSGAVEAIGRLTATLAADSDYIDAVAADELARRRLPDGLIDLGGETPRPVLSRIITFAAREAGANPEYTHICDLAAAYESGGDCSVTLPGGIIASLRGGKLGFRRDFRIKKTKTPEKT